MSETLALFGGEKTINQSFQRYNPIGQEEVAAAMEVVKSGQLSPYIGEWVTDTEFGGFFGGPKVQEFERAIEKCYGVRHAVTVNSATSGLIAAIGAVQVEPGDEVIVSPWTMCASATAILWWNAIPVFADIERETFNLDPVAVKKRLTPQTKAIVVPDIFGHPADLDAILDIADERKLALIEDASQSPLARYKQCFAGTVAHIGILSLNYHKHIHTGEGGICLTDDPVLAERLQLIRNHAEAVVGDKGVSDITNMIGFNFRLGEIEAAIGRQQLKKLDRVISDRTSKADRLTKGLHELSGLRTPITQKDCSHVFYVYPLVLDLEMLNCSRARIFQALQAEGVPVSEGYANIHLLPMFQEKIAYGRNGFPWNSDIYKGDVEYHKGICPVAEDFHERTLLAIAICSYEYSDVEIDRIIDAFHKVWNNLDQLR